MKLSHCKLHHDVSLDMNKRDKPEDWTFEQALASKAETSSKVTDEQWYVVLVAQCCLLYEGLSPGDFRFSINPPNPEIQRFFDRRVPPHLCAIELFQVRH